MSAFANRTLSLSEGIAYVLLGRTLLLYCVVLLLNYNSKYDNYSYDDALANHIFFSSCALLGCCVGAFAFLFYDEGYNHKH